MEIKRGQISAPGWRKTTRQWPWVPAEVHSRIRGQLQARAPGLGQEQAPRVAQADKSQEC